MTIPNLSNETVLIVDDHAPSLKLYQVQLRGTGATVTTATNGTDGLEALTTDNETPFSLVIADYHLPGMNGGEMLETYLTSNPNSPAALIGVSSDPDSYKRHNIPNLTVFQKDGSKQSLYKAINQALSQRQLE